jgi:Fe-S-cluster-containing hydrogenase component 2
MDVCPVDCIYTGVRKNYINAYECIDCAACKSVCPADAIYPDKLSAGDSLKSRFAADSKEFFESVLPGRDEPVGNPGGSMLIGDIDQDTRLVTSYPNSPAG